LATEKIIYLNYAEAVLIHLRLMQALGETRYGVDFRELIDSALSRPKHSAIYENADLIRQSATLLFGLVKNHPWLGGNKRTATTLLQRFLEQNGYQKNWTNAEQLQLVLAVESDAWKVDEIEDWLRNRAVKV
jgi:death on curing protein